MKQVRTSFTWPTLIHDFNAKTVRTHDVLAHKEDQIKKFKKRCKTKEEFAAELNKDFMWRYFARSEYEMILYMVDNRVYLEPWCGTFKEGKIDITDDLTLNWPAFAEKMLSERGWHDVNNKRTYVKFDIYDQLKFRFDELVEFVWNYRHKYQRNKKEII